MPNVFAKQTALSNVGGRIDYISSPKRQEHLLAYHDGAADKVGGAYWTILAQECQEAQKHTASGRKCVQGRELIIPLSNALLQRMSPEQIAKTLAEDYEREYHRPCAVAIHWNKDMTNLHAHLIYSERALLPEPEVKIAPRAIFFDEEGKRRYKKKEVLDEAGELRHGCRIVAKGDVYEQRCFGPVDPSFSRKGWLQECKTNWLLPLRNGALRGDVEITEFDKNSGKLPQQHVGKVQHTDSPEAQAAVARIEEYNEAVKEWNGYIDKGLLGPKTIQTVQEKVDKAPRKNNVIMTFVQRVRDILAARLQALSARSEPQVGVSGEAAQTAPAEPTPSFDVADLRAAAQEYCRQTAALNDHRRDPDPAITGLPVRLRNAVAQMQEGHGEYHAASQRLAELPKRPVEPKGVVLPKKKKEYQAAYQAWERDIYPTVKELHGLREQAKAKLEGSFAVLHGFMHDGWFKVGYSGSGYTAGQPNIDPVNMTPANVAQLLRGADGRLRELDAAADAERKRCRPADAPRANPVAQRAAQERLESLCQDVPRERWADARAVLKDVLREYQSDSYINDRVRAATADISTRLLSDQREAEPTQPKNKTRPKSNDSR